MVNASPLKPHASLRFCVTSFQVGVLRGQTVGVVIGYCREWLKSNHGQIWAFWGIPKKSDVYA